MFGIGYQEMFIVLVVAMVIFGPSRLPELAGQVGRWVRDFRRMSSDLTGEFEKTFAEVEEVKKSFKREFDAIQDEVEGAGKSVRGDLKKSTAKASAAKKPAALGSGTRNAAKGAGAKAASAAKDAAANGAKTTGTGLGARGRASANSANGLADHPVATKADPLVDVSFLELDVIGAKNGSSGAGNGIVRVTDDDALSRVRQRRAAASYSRRIPA